MMNHRHLCGFCTILLLATSQISLAADETTPERPDILIADFESDDYGDWQVEGEAFGPGPAAGTLPSQMPVSGYEGKRLVNSYYNGDGATGKLTSPTFPIERNYLIFLIGGGGFEGETCMRLLIDGKEVRQAVGDNTLPGGSEKLAWKCWDVTEFRGKAAAIEIIDQGTGGWGHINVDHIVQSDERRGPIANTLPKVTLSREIVLERPFLHIPVKTGNVRKWLQLVVDGQVVRELTVEIAEEGERPDFYGSLQTTDWLGKPATLRVERMSEGSKALDAILPAVKPADPDTAYTESLRPLFHFTTRYGWINDPNGLLYYDGLYHMFSQHNPVGVAWENMTWSYATSPDLLHWRQGPDALLPDELGTMFSGSGVVDHNNTSGFQTGDEKPLVLIYTAAGGSNRLSKDAKFTQCLAYSNDGGKTWTKYDANPVLEHIEGGNRDPKVFWHEPSQQWVMTLYLDREDYALFGSPNLKEWKKLCDIRNLGCSECPDMFELPVDGDANNKKWVFWGGNGMYLIGTFDGKTFVPESKPLPTKYGGNDYAAQSWSDIPESDGRRIQISWMSGGQYPGMPFNQQYTVPRELTLRTTPDGVRLFMYPIKEIESLRATPVGEAIKDHKVLENNGVVFMFGNDKDAFDAELVIDFDSADKLAVDVLGQKIEYDVKAQRISLDGIAAPLKLLDGKLHLRVLVDRTSIELFAQHGEVQIAKCFLPDKDADKRLEIIARGGNATFDSINVWEMRSTLPR